MANPLMVRQPVVSRVRLAAANTDVSSLTNATQFTLPTAPVGAVSFRVDRITVRNAQASYAASSAMTTRIHLSEAAGANPRLYVEQALAAATRSATVVGATTTFNFIGGLIMQIGEEIWASQSVYAGVQDQNDFTLEGGYQE